MQRTRRKTPDICGGCDKQRMGERIRADGPDLSFSHAGVAERRYLFIDEPSRSRYWGSDGWR